MEEILNLLAMKKEEENKVKVRLQGACSGCPSSSRTLKNGIEGILRKLLKDDNVVVEAIN